MTDSDSNQETPTDQAAESAETPEADTESRIAALLECRFGDGMVYLPSNLPQALMRLAMQRGFIDAEGYLTRKGRTLIARFHYA